MEILTDSTQGRRDYDLGYPGPLKIQFVGRQSLETELLLLKAKSGTRGFKPGSNVQTQQQRPLKEQRKEVQDKKKEEKPNSTTTTPSTFKPGKRVIRKQVPMPTK